MVPRAEVILEGWKPMSDEPIEVTFPEQEGHPGLTKGDLVVKVGNKPALRLINEDDKAEFKVIGRDFPDIDSFEKVE